MKPDIIFFGEKFPKTMEIQMKKDMLTCDAILVIGTSLKVGGSVVELLKNVDASIPQILINKDPISLSSKISEGFDVTLLGCCDDVIAYLQQELRWKDDVLSIPSNNKVYTCESISNRMYVCSSHHKSNEILIHENLVKTHDEHTLQEPAGSLKSTRKRTRNQFLD
jgi:thiamine pyrophosphate-dependent acetolactate synthase large subunit-like protein